MSHEVESMMFVGQQPWHGLGMRLEGAPSVVDAIKAAGLDWTVSLHPLAITPDPGIVSCGAEVPAPVEEREDEDEEDLPPLPATRPCLWRGDWPDVGGFKTRCPRCGSTELQAGTHGRVVGHRAVVRDTDKRVLGVVGPIWHPLQNVEAFDFFEPFVKAGVATLETAGSLRDGQRVWVLARLAVDPIEVRPGDPVVSYVLLSNSHDGSLAVRVGYTPVRVVCANTLASAHQSGQSQLLRVIHSKRTVEALSDVRETMDLARRTFVATVEQYQRLAEVGVHEGDLERYVKVVFGRGGNGGNGNGNGGGEVPPAGDAPEDDGSASPAPTEGRALGAIREIYDGKAHGMDLCRGTWWGLYNAVNTYVVHSRGTDAGRRLDSAWFTDGAALNRRALKVALQGAGLEA